MNSKRAGLLGRATTRMAVGVIAVVAIVVAATDVSYAYYSSTGTGTGTAATGTATISLPTTAATVSGLYPGASITNVQATVTNSSPTASVVLKTLTVGTVVTTQTGCNPSVVGFAPDALPTPAIAAHGTATVTGTVTMGVSAANACQGATFTIPITVTAQAG